MIHMKDITFHYAKNPLFSKLDLEIPRGNIYGLLGMNGAGKTTLLKLISGQLFRTEGKAEVMGFDPQQRNPEMLADMFYLPEEFYLQKISMEEFLKIYTPFYPKFNKTELDSYLNIFGIDTSKKLSDLSFGQKKKFLLSFGLASNTSLLILDEPTNGLDIPSKSQFRRIVASALTDDRTFIISTHQVRDMENLIDPIIILHDGKVVFNSPLADVADNFSILFSTQEPLEETVLYKEKVPGGWTYIQTREEETAESSIDLETLFNAVISSPNSFSGKNTTMKAKGGKA